MIKIYNTCEEDIDILKLEGQLDEDGLFQLRDVIELLRQQNSTRLLLIGSQLNEISTRELSGLEAAFRNYRSLGGRIALAEFPQECIEKIRKTTWCRYLNIFEDTEIAKQFLSAAIRQKWITQKKMARLQSLQNDQDKQADNQNDTTGTKDSNQTISEQPPSITRHKTALKSNFMEKDE